MAEYSAARSLLPLSELEFACTAALVEPRLTPGEDLRDVMSGAAHIARRRCCWLHKPAELSDLAFALALFDWWPVKPVPAPGVRAALVSLRRRVFKGAAQFVFERDPTHELYWLVPVATLMLEWPALFERQALGVHAFLSPIQRQEPDSEPDYLPDVAPPELRYVLESA